MVAIPPLMVAIPPLMAVDTQAESERKDALVGEGGGTGARVMGAWEGAWRRQVAACEGTWARVRGGPSSARTTTLLTTVQVTSKP